MTPRSHVVGAALLLASLSSATRGRAEETEPETTVEESHEERGGDGRVSRQVFGWSAVGLGAALVGVGGVLGGLAWAKYEELDCPEDRCAPERVDDMQAYNDLRVPSGLVLFSGLLVMGIGVPFLVIDAGDDEVAITPALAPGFVGVSGSF